GERVRDWVVWFGPARLATSALAIIAVVAGGAWLLQSSPSRPEDALPFATRPSATGPSAVEATSAPSTTSLGSIVVYVTGDVVSPGVYTLDSPARVNDAVAAAGGGGPNADLTVVNLAAPVHDGERVYVPIVGATVPPLIEAAPSTMDSEPAGPVNINTATMDQLDVLPGVGPTTAAAIVAHRQQHGPFQTVEQLADVRGIGPAKLDALRGLVTV
ncbi:MAG TPA: ComEA family DNA-binding protein, partial [Ilumatobacteraceae bacterium]|nr:ComEA family DNA-binding protein [Ilumatobacteraceae bacterium]